MEEDRTRWNKRYDDGEYSHRIYPSVFLQEWINHLPKGRALDLACGNGRNLVYLKEHGYEITGIDISDSAIKLAARMLGIEGIGSLQRRDLEAPLTDIGLFDLIILVRYVNLDLMAKLPSFLKPGGMLLIEEHLHWDDPYLKLEGPQNPDFRIKQGTLKSLFQSYKVKYLFEGLVEEPNRQTAALGQIVVENKPNTPNEKDN